MIKSHLGVISSKGLDLQYVYMAFDFHDVTTLAKICAFSFVSLSGALLLFVIALVDLDDATCGVSFGSRRRIISGSVLLNALFGSFYLH